MDPIWKPEDFIQVGDSVRCRVDGPSGPAHLVVEVQSGNECAIACKNNAFFRSALDWKAGRRSSAPRWKVLEPVNCIVCLAEAE